jgi:hypothetical protein
MGLERHTEQAVRVLLMINIEGWLALGKYWSCSSDVDSTGFILGNSGDGARR